MPRTSSVHAVTTIGMDMGKNTLHMIGLDSRGAIVLREKVSRGRIASRLANLSCCLIGIEAGLATHYVARELAALGHDVKHRHIDLVLGKALRVFGHAEVIEPVRNRLHRGPTRSRGAFNADVDLIA